MKEKVLKVVLAILLISNVVMFIVTIYQDYNSSYIIFDENNIWRVRNDKITKVSSSNIKRLSYSNVKIYDEENIDGYYSNDDDYNIYDASFEIQYGTYYTFLVIGDLNVDNYISLINMDVSTTEVEDIINKALLKEGINASVSDLYIHQAKISNSEYIYSIVPYDDAELDANFSIIFLYDINAGDVNIIYSKNNDDEYLRMSSLYNLIDIDGDNILEVVLLSDIYGSAGNECYSLYKYNNNIDEYEPVIDCEE